MMPDNFRQAAHFRELVALALAQEGLAVALPGRPLKISEALAPDAPRFSRSHILGIPEMTLHVRAELRMNLGENLDIVAKAAAQDGNSISAVVQYRRGRPAAEQFVIVTLATFAALVKQGQP